MSIAAIVGQIQSIQSVIAQLSTAMAPAAAPSADTTTAAQGTGQASPTTFDAALSGALGSTAAAVTTASPGTTVSASNGTLVENGTTGADVVADAKRYLGVPYVFGGTTDAGLDCSGLVQKVYGDLGITMPRLVTGQMSMGVAVPSIQDAQPGDLIVADGGNHIAIYAGNGQIIEAPHPGMDVLERADWITPSNTVTIRRIVPSAGTS